MKKDPIVEEIHQIRGKSSGVRLNIEIWLRIKD
jgi:hypothetical protein